MHPVSRLLTVRFDTVTRRFIGVVALTRTDGSEETVRASVVGHPAWPLERVARLLMGAARLDRVA